MGGHMPANPHFLSAPQGARIIFLTAFGLSQTVRLGAFVGLRRESLGVFTLKSQSNPPALVSARSPMIRA